MGKAYILFLIAGALMYVMPYTLTDAIFHHLSLQWFQLIVDNRPKDGEAEAGLSDINDIRNGMFANLMICSAFDDREIVILKVCHICSPIYSLAH